MTLPLFSTHYSLPQNGSLLTLDEPGKAKPGAPVSVFDLALEGKLKEVVVVDDHPDGFIAAYKGALKAKTQLIYGLKLTVCANADAKDDASLGTQSKVIVFARDTEGYHKLVSIWNRAATTGFYYSSRTSWTWLKEQWSDHLLLALPWASSFVAKNTLTFNRIVPDLPARPWVFREVATDLPFARLIDAAIDRYVKESGMEVQDVKSVYYAKRADIEPYQVMRAIGLRGASFNSPNVDHLSSDAFSFEAWQALQP